MQLNVIGISNSVCDGRADKFTLAYISPPKRNRGRRRRSWTGRQHGSSLEAKEGSTGISNKFPLRPLILTGDKGLFVSHSPAGVCLPIANQHQYAHQDLPLDAPDYISELSLNLEQWPEQ